ncbi:MULTISPECIES: diguanylate cyclase [unclassified Paenibacillus]|uniref:sensor domain-containing diguanylate cyclase n=1 Tax=unclassified Paenibacillus TaxID=185978 RepID=UPI001AE49C59|nr:MULTISPECIES: diguanylate cyclase [unclassified Paenibacillus]MBP1154677.1 diguanylate cyclase (GGDEF)-like protein [Paenibacillus sp. PvP091]MBP1169939.1 diguanylate cyclase (GGDEF)-like protein [Paenibacillus sp. PvR098]MBP2440967.1 diguanylate cyclase (GGDEF)-like protein [Paenibacillus sp. PvP052]
MFKVWRRLLPKHRFGSDIIQSLTRMMLVLGLFFLFMIYLINGYQDRLYNEISQLEQISRNVLILQKSLIDQETAQRGYSLTGDSTFIQTYEESSDEYLETIGQMYHDITQYPYLIEPFRELFETGLQWKEKYGLLQLEAFGKGEQMTTEELLGGKPVVEDFRNRSMEISRMIHTKKSDLSNAYMSRITQTLYVSIVICAVVIGLAVADVVHKLRRIIRPINELSCTVEGYARQQFDVSVPSLKQDDELSKLFDHIEHMRLMLKHQFEHSRSQVYMDGLTGVGNRRYFDESLDLALERAQMEGEAFSLILMDIDRFKRFNDTYGHAEGDKLLKHISGVMQRILPDYMVLARYGGEEFAVIVPGKGMDEAFLVAEKLRREVERQALDSYRVTASFGISRVSEGDTPEALLVRADQALYASKNNGRNCVSAG